MNDELKFKIRSLNKAFGTNHVLKGIDLDVAKGSSLIILGGSGSGKSVLIKLMVGLVTADSGSILYEGNESLGMSYKERLKMLENCGYLFQAGALFDSLTVQQNITFLACLDIRQFLAATKRLSVKCKASGREKYDIFFSVELANLEVNIIKLNYVI